MSKTHIEYGQVGDMLDELKFIPSTSMHRRLSKAELDLVARILGAKVINSDGSCYYGAALAKCITIL